MAQKRLPSLGFNLKQQPSKKERPMVALLPPKNRKWRYPGNPRKPPFIPQLRRLRKRR
jgi:hypothetical protein